MKGYDIMKNQINWLNEKKFPFVEKYDCFLTEEYSTHAKIESIKGRTATIILFNSSKYDENLKVTTKSKRIILKDGKIFIKSSVNKNKVLIATYDIVQ